MTLRALGLALGLLAGVAHAQGTDIADAIEHARHLSVTEAVPASQPVIDALMERLDEATPSQRAEIRLLYIRNLALQGANAEAIDRLEALLDGSLSDDQRLRALRLAANVGINMGRYEWGFTRLKAALELLPRIDDPAEETRILSLAGFVHSMVGDHERAIHYTSQAVEIAERAENVGQRCSSGQVLAVAYRYSEQFELAEEAASEALVNCRRADDHVHWGVVELELAYLALERDELDSAERWIDQGLDRLRKAVWVDGILTGEQLRARLAAARGQHRAAMELAEKLIVRVRERQFWEREAALHRLVASQLAEMDDFAGAYEHMVAHSEARERFLDEDRARRLAILEVEFDVQRHEQELELLREQKRVAELEAQSRRQEARVRMLAAGFAGFLFIILVLLLIHVLRERRHFRRLSQLDGLTRVSNHTRFFDTARLLVEEAQRSGQPLVLAVGDIDHFKQVNDEHGHIVGDEALREVARVLRENFPGLGHVGRIGGEEFAVCLPEVRLDPVVDQLHKVRADLAAIEYGANGKPLTMSFGVAALGPDERLEELRRRADDALYRAKRGGRNSVVVAEKPDEN